jgi:hypothetical protein
MADEIPVACCLSDEGLIVHTAPIEDEHKPIVLDCSEQLEKVGFQNEYPIVCVESRARNDGLFRPLCGDVLSRTAIFHL